LRDERETLRVQLIAADRENLAGLVERVTFHNEDSCVLRVKARGQRDLVTVFDHVAALDGYRKVS
jgi:hypothetical protein